MKYFIIYIALSMAFFTSLNEGLSKSVQERCNAGLVPVQYCQK